MITTRWFKGIKTEDEKDKLKRRLEANKDLFEILRGILQEDYNSLLEDGMKKDNYFMPAWSEYQADKIGSQRTLKKVIDILP